jgi:hypothetical protein
MNTKNLLGIQPELRDYIDSLGVGLPPIRGTWFVVDPYGATYPAVGDQPGQIVADLETAYGLCTSGFGDGILVLSGGTGTASQTSSYLSHPLVWSKHGITVVGACAPTKFAQRARISNVTHTTGSISVLAFVAGSGSTYDKITRTTGSFITNGFEVGDYIRINTTGNGADATGLIISAVEALTLTLTTIGTLVTETAANAGASVVSSYCTDLISVTGSNNSFYNLHITHTGADALELTALKVSGSRNYFSNVHAGVGVADANTTITHSLWLSAAAENTFEGCVFGLDTVDRGGVATYDIYLSGAVARNRFYDCETVRHSSTGTGCLAVYADTTTGGRPTLFKNCIFTIWNTAGGNANCSYMGGSTGACDFIWLVNCDYPGYAALSNDSVFWISGEVNSQASGLMYT